MFRELAKRMFRRSLPQPTPKLMKDDLRYRRYNIGEFTYGAPVVLSWSDDTNLSVGRFCSIAEGVTILLGGEHRVDWISTYPFEEMLQLEKPIIGHPHSKGNVNIGNDVWIGRGAMILSGVSIGDGAVIGAGSLVTRSVSPYEIVAGNPARVIRKRFDNDVIQQLLCIKWWDWPICKIKERVHHLSQSDSEMFFRKVALAPSDSTT